MEINYCIIILHIAGSDLLSAITATFEKMRSLQESPLGPVTAGADGGSATPEAGQPHHHGKARGSSECRLYRDPSLHRRRTNPRSPSASTSTTSTATTTVTTTTSQVGLIAAFLKGFEVYEVHFFSIIQGCDWLYGFCFFYDCPYIFSQQI